MKILFKKAKKLKSYKNYGIEKIWEVDTHNNKAPESTIYRIYDVNGYIGEKYKTLKKAKKQIDKWKSIEKLKIVPYDICAMKMRSEKY